MTEDKNIYLADTTDDHGKVNRYIDKFRGDSSLQFVPERLKLLLSYHYFKNTDLEALMAKYFGEKIPKIFIDSGGFSAATQGVDIDIDAYCDWLKQYQSLIHVYANLDVIGDPEKTYEQQKMMEDRGLKPIPVFHTGEPVSWLERYIDEGYDYIALGGMVPYARDRKKLIQWMSMCFKVAEDSGKEIGYHGFGMTNWDLMRAYPWKSVDSSSWCSGFRYGAVYLFDEKKGRFFQVQLRDIKKSYKYAEILRRYGFSPNDLALEGEFDRVKVASISALSFMKAEAWLNEKSQSRRSLRRSPSVSGSTECDGNDEGSVPRSDGGSRGGDKDDSGLYLVTLPPMEKGSEHNPDSKWVGGTQMFDSFKNITSGENDGSQTDTD